MTLDQLQQNIYHLYDGSDVSYHQSTSEDYLLRKGLINTAIEDWAMSYGVKWRELFTTGTAGSTVPSQSQYDIPQDFIHMVSEVKVNYTTGVVYYQYKKLEDRLLSDRANPSERYYTITGKVGSFKLDLNPIPDQVGVITFDYYKKPTPLVNGSDVTEVPNPLYLVYYTVSRLYEQDNRSDLAQTYEQRATTVLNQMIVNNNTNPYSADQIITKLRTTSLGFGK